MADTPASKAGIKEEDVILSFDGKDIEDMKDLQMKVADTPVGKKVRIVVWRDKKEVPLSLMIAEMPPDEQLATMKDGVSWRGIKVSAITDEVKERLRIDESSGVVVTMVEEDSAAYESGISAGTVILGIDGSNIKGLADYRDIVKKIPADRDVRLRVMQNANVRLLLLKGEK
jgi:serine protease Do